MMRNFRLTKELEYTAAFLYKHDNALLGNIKIWFMYNAYMTIYTIYTYVCIFMHVLHSYMT